MKFFISLAAGEWAAQREPSTFGYYRAPGVMAAVSPPKPSAVRKRKEKQKSGIQIEQLMGKLEKLKSFILMMKPGRYVT